MSDMITRAENMLLAPAELTLAQVQRQIASAAHGLDWLDMYFQVSTSEGWRLEDGEVKTGHYSADSGVGLRALRGETTACASSDIIAPQTIADIRRVAQVAKTHGGHLALGDIAPPVKAPPRFVDINPVEATADVEKIALLQKIDTIARAADARVENVIASVGASFSAVLIVRADGMVSADLRPMVRLSVQVIMAAGGKRETGGAGCGGRLGFDYFDEDTVQRAVLHAVHEATQKLDAKPAPAGVMPVVLGPGWAGVILHEAVGHGLEGDFNRKQQSAFSGRIGERVAARGVSVIDAGDIAERRGSLSCDDEGTPTQATTLIEDGVLCGYMQDIANARLMKTAPTGNGRRESYAHPPMPRMTNTFMPAGERTPEEIIASVERGLYAADFNGGEVDITNGNFVFVAAKARLIEKGKLGAVVKGATIIGNGPAIMPKISMLGNDFSLDPGMGNCGKNGQWVPVGVGQPTIKVDELNVGGEAQQ